MRYLYDKKVQVVMRFLQSEFLLGLYDSLEQTGMFSMQSSMERYGSDHVENEEDCQIFLD